MINGRECCGEVEPRRLLVDFIRDDLGLTGTHVGCEHGVCGACTVVVDGAAVRASQEPLSPEADQLWRSLVARAAARKRVRVLP